MGSPARVHGPFEYYDVTGDAVRGAADAPGAKAGEVDDISNQLDGDEKKMVDATEGDIAAGVEKNPKAAKNSAKNLAANGQWACACLREFAGDIDTFDGTTAGLNERYNSAVFSAQHDPSVRSGDKSLSEVKKSLEAAFRDPEYTNAEEALETAADKVAGKLEDPPSPDDVIAMIRAGFMPLTAAGAFPKVKLSADDKRAAIKALMKGKTPGEVAKILQNDKKLRTDPAVMDAVRDRISKYDPEQGKSDAKLIGAGGKDALDAAGRLALVGVYGKYAQQHDKTIPANGARYLRDVVAGTFKDGVKKANSIQDALDETGSNLTKGLLANSLLLASDERLDPLPARGPDNYPNEPILGKGAVPQKVLDALHDVPSMGGGGPGATKTPVSSGEGFAELASLLRDSDKNIEAGTDFSHDLTTTTADVAQMINNAGDGHSPGGGFMAKSGFELDGEEVDNLSHALSGDMETMLDVASRNEEANSELLSSANSDADTARDLVSLYNFDWKDDGESVGGYTDWIEDGMKPGASESERDMARRASGDLIELMTTTSHPDDSDLNPFKELMTNAGHDEVDEQKSFGDYNPDLVDSLAGVASRNLDAFASNPATGSHEVEFNPGEDGKESSLSIYGGDRGRFFTLLATDDDAYNELSRNVGAYQQVNLNHAIDADSPATAGMENSRLDAYVRGGFLNERMAVNNGDYDAAMEDYKDTRAAMEMGRDAVTFSMSATGWGGVAAAPPTNLILNEVIDSTLDKPEMQTYDTSTESNEEYSKTKAGYSYLAARYQHDPGSLTEAQREAITEDGKVIPLHDVSPDYLDEIKMQKDYTSDDDAPEAERGRNEYVMNNQYSNTFDEVYADEDIDKYLDGEDPAPKPGG